MNKQDAIETLVEFTVDHDEPQHTETRVQVGESEDTLARNMRHYVDTRVAHWFVREYNERSDGPFNYGEWAKQVLSTLQRQVNQMARDPESSTGTLHNMRKRHYLAAQADFVLNGFGSSDVAEAVHTLAKQG